MLFAGYTPNEIYFDPNTNRTFERLVSAVNTTWFGWGSNSANECLNEDYYPLERRRKELMMLGRDTSSQATRGRICAALSLGILSELLPIINQYLCVLYPRVLVPMEQRILKAHLRRFDFANIIPRARRVHGSEITRGHKTGCRHLYCGSYLVDGLWIRDVEWCDKMPGFYERDRILGWQSRVQPIVACVLEKMNIFYEYSVMQREIIIFGEDHPLPPDVQRIVLTLFDAISKTTITIGADVRRLIIGADIFGFLWRMLLDPCRREAIIDTIYSDSQENFMIYISRWHAAEFNVYVQTLPFKRQTSVYSYPEITHDWRALSRWAGWMRRISSGQVKGVMFVCRQYFMSKMMTFTIPNTNLREFMRVVLKSETLTRLVRYVKNPEAFYKFMTQEDLPTRDYLRKMGANCFEDLWDTPLEGELEAMMKLLKAVR